MQRNTCTIEKNTYSLFINYLHSLKNVSSAILRKHRLFALNLKKIPPRKTNSATNQNNCYNEKEILK